MTAVVHELKKCAEIVTPTPFLEETVNELVVAIQQEFTETLVHKEEFIPGIDVDRLRAAQKSDQECLPFIFIIGVDEYQVCR